MRTEKRFYHRTAAGERALQFSGDDVAVLVVIEDATHFETVCARLPAWSEAKVLRSLASLEHQGLIESVAVEWVRELYRLGRYEPAALTRRAAPASSSYKA